jgi:predicted nuclease of restriction endonuclease-like (RecB) superfamily
MENGLTTPQGYADLLEQLKLRIRSARWQAALSVNRELVRLYWEIGQSILERQEREGWGAKVIERLAADLRHEFPDMRGLSTTNLKS